MIRNALAALALGGSLIVILPGFFQNLEAQQVTPPSPELIERYRAILAIASLRLGDLDSAELFLEQAVDLGANETSGIYPITDLYFNMALKSQEQGDANGAIRYFLKVLSGNPERYVSKPLAEQILQQKDELQLGGEVREVTVLFSDIRRFTSLAEKLPPEQVVEILNDYFTRMIDEVNIAARMQGIAQPGEVLISENTYGIVSEAINATPLEPITFKGKNTVVAVYRVDGLRENK
jgi:tetratricopeptide (TPR) repeat protein